ncbi:MAG: antibiotic biosynthesis monooxygenase [Bacteroidetes bacterium]|jgi:autoinducer 2-degrading protein|nr:MAG: antibiotic biosynthesis monooxygenase [Bacteroidota bacterium]RLD94694.1 MAG: antibiotic biosynthesis monooxygenase [Bacteroidota bacterium]
MYITIVHIKVLPDYIDLFIQASTENHLESVKEPGNLRFDLLRSDDNPARFVLYEAYENESAATAHKETAHYLKWRETVAPWMAVPREGIRYTGLQPEF